MMKKYRIGRVQMPWANREPPIRAAKPDVDARVSEKTGDETELKGTHTRSRASVDLCSVSLVPHDERTSYSHLPVVQCLTDTCFKVASTISKKLNPMDGCTRTCRSRTPDPEKQPLLRSEASQPPAFDKTVHRYQFATEIEQKEIQEGLQENPSIDEATQQQILVDYRELHEQVKAQGLYQCNYREYGKECIRYGLLFATFAYLLYCKWYLTSSIFLGLFWVSQPRDYSFQSRQRF